MAFDLDDIDLKDEDNYQNDFEKDNILNRDIDFGLSSFGEKSKEQLYSGLSTLLESGVDLNRSLEIMVEEFSKKKDKSIIENLIKQVQSGDNLSDAMSNDPKKAFSLYEIATIRIGEEVGKMDYVTRELQTYYKGSIKRKRMLTSALSYPILVSIIAVLAVVFMMAFVVPMFEDIFKRFDGELPAITQFVISVSTQVNDNLIFLLGGGLVVFILLKLFLRNVKVKSFFAHAVVRIPFIGSFIIKTYLSKLSGVLGMMLGSGVHLLKALELSKDAVSFIPYQEALEKTIRAVEEGSTFHESITNKVLFPNKFRSLIKVGEEVNKLDYFFDKANKEYNEELEHSTAILGTVLEPILLVFLGGAIGVILVSMYLPLFDLSSQW